MSEILCLAASTKNGVWSHLNGSFILINMFFFYFFPEPYYDVGLLNKNLIKNNKSSSIGYLMIIILFHDHGRAKDGEGWTHLFIRAGTSYFLHNLCGRELRVGGVNVLS